MPPMTTMTVVFTVTAKTAASWAGDIRLYAHTERSGLLALRAAYAAIIDDMEDENGK